MQFLEKLGPQASSCAVCILMCHVAGDILSCVVAGSNFRCRLAVYFEVSCSREYFLVSSRGCILRCNSS